MFEMVFVSVFLINIHVYTVTNAEIQEYGWGKMRPMQTPSLANNCVVCLTCIICVSHFSASVVGSFYKNGVQLR